MAHGDFATDLDQLIGTVYECAWVPERWNDLLIAIARTFRSVMPGIASGGAESRWQTCALTDERRVAEYAEHYGRELVNLAFQRTLVGQAFELERLREGAMERWAFYADWMQPQQLQAGLGCYVPVADGEILGIGVYRERGQPDYDERDRAMLDRLMPHLCRAVQIAARIDVESIERWSLESVLESLNIGLVVLDDRMRILALNDEAERIVARRDGLYVSNGALRGSSPEATRALERSLRGALDTCHSRGTEAGGAIRLPRTATASAYEILVGSAPRHALAIGRTRAAVLVFVRDPDNRLRPDAAMLRDLFDLTAAEARVAAAVATGRSVSELADDWGVTVQTIRNQLRVVFDKTNTHRQAELSALLQGSLATLTPRAGANRDHGAGGS